MPKLIITVQGVRDNRRVDILVGYVDAIDIPLITALRLRIDTDQGDLLCFPFQLTEEGPEYFVKYEADPDDQPDDEPFDFSIPASRGHNLARAAMAALDNDHEVGPDWERPHRA